MNSYDDLREVITNVLLEEAVKNRVLQETEGLTAIRDHLFTTLSQTYDWKLRRYTT